MSGIHPTALIDAGAELGDQVCIGPFAVIEQDVVLGDGCEVGAHSVIKRHTRMGQGNQVHEHVVIGGTPQDRKFQGCASRVEIGDGNVIREGVTIHRGSKEGAVTRIGNGNYLMACCHIAHDCVIGDEVTIANNTLFAGYVTVASRAFVSGAVTIHQFCRVGTLAMVGASARINQDCLPYVLTDGVPGRARGLNLVGLKRVGMAADDIRALKRAYRVLCSGRQLGAALAELGDSDSAPVRELCRFIEGSRRGFAHPQGER